MEEDEFILGAGTNAGRFKMQGAHSDQVDTKVRMADAFEKERLKEGGRGSRKYILLTSNM